LREIRTPLDGELNGDCHPVRKYIRVNANRSPAQQVKTLAHEIGHALLHSDPDGAAVHRSIKELEAESVAYVVCGKLGLDSSAYSFGYLAIWAAGGESAAAAITQSAQRINRAARTILDSLPEPAQLNSAA
jgi:antirestriction protein ArdC